MVERYLSFFQFKATSQGSPFHLLSSFLLVAGQVPWSFCVASGNMISVTLCRCYLLSGIVPGHQAQSWILFCCFSESLTLATPGPLVSKPACTASSLSWPQDPRSCPSASEKSQKTSPSDLCSVQLSHQHLEAQALVRAPEGHTLGCPRFTPWDSQQMF